MTWISSDPIGITKRMGVPQFCPKLGTFYKKRFPMSRLGWVFCLTRHLTNEVISVEKGLITFLSSLNRSLLRLIDLTSQLPYVKPFN